MADGSVYRSHAATPRDAWGDELTPAPVPELVYPDPVGVPGGPPPDVVNWFGNPPDVAAVNLNTGQPAAAAVLAAAVRCCVPPDADTPHHPLCPVYGYPPPTPPRDGWEQSRHYAATDPGISVPGGPGVPGPYVPAAEPSPTVNLTETARRAVGQSPVLSYGDMIPDPVAGVGWGDLAQWAFEADRRFEADPEGRLWCGALGDTGTDADRCRHPESARWDPAYGSPTDYLRTLVIFLTLHWPCWEEGTG